MREFQTSNKNTPATPASPPPPPPRIPRRPRTPRSRLASSTHGETGGATAPAKSGPHKASSSTPAPPAPCSRPPPERRSRDAESRETTRYKAESPAYPAPPRAKVSPHSRRRTTSPRATRSTTPFARRLTSRAARSSRRGTLPWSADAQGRGNPAIRERLAPPQPDTPAHTHLPAPADSRSNTSAAPPDPAAPGFAG